MTTNSINDFTDSNTANGNISIEMRNGSILKMVDKCQYLGTTLYLDGKHKHTPDIVRDIKVSFNNLFVDL